MSACPGPAVGAVVDEAETSLGFVTYQGGVGGLPAVVIEMARLDDRAERSWAM